MLNMQNNMMPEIIPENIFLEKDIIFENEIGINIVCDLVINNLRGVDVILILSFYWAGQQYRGGIVIGGGGEKWSLDGQHLEVSAQLKDIPYDSTEYNGFCFFVPYSQLTLKGKRGLYKIQSAYNVYVPNGTQLQRITGACGPNIEIEVIKPFMGNPTYNVKQIPIR